jgi:hypothetical protein
MTRLWTPGGLRPWEKKIPRPACEFAVVFTADRTGRHIAYPFTTRDAVEAVGQLVLGRWLGFPWEWVEDDAEPGTWVTGLRAACMASDPPVTLDGQEMPRLSLTIAMNAAPDKTPSERLAVESAEAILALRERGNPLPSIHKATTGQEDRYAGYRRAKASGILALPQD